MIRIPVIKVETIEVGVCVKVPIMVHVDVGTHTHSSGGDNPYTGPYQFTPTEQTQTIQIADKTATQNIIINPIPSNYGRITRTAGAILVS